MENKTSIYESSSSQRIHLSAWKDMVGELCESRELIQRLTARNIAGQFRQSFLGYIWIALPPVALTIVFTLLRQANIINIPDNLMMPYALFALLGTTLWGVFTQTTMMATMSIAGSGNLVSKIYFPREVLVLSAVGNSVFNSAVRFGVIGLTFLILQYGPCWQVIFFPLLMVPLFALSIGLGFIFAPINTMMNDMSRILEFVFQFGLFLAPTVYPTPALADANSYWETALCFLHNANPVSHFIYAFQDLIVLGHVNFDMGLNLSIFGSFAVLLFGWRFFHICEPFLAERL